MKLMNILFVPVVILVIMAIYVIADSQNVNDTLSTPTPTFTEIPTNTSTPIFSETLRSTLAVEEQATIAAFETKAAEYPSICKKE